MLGNGRPFVIELISPKKAILCTADILEELENKINNNTKLIAVKSLKITNNTCFKELTNAADTKIKAYAALVQFKSPINNDYLNQICNINNLEINQLTPLRVLHRRTLMNRKKIIYVINFRKISETQIICFLLTSAGTYIKEFVHSDIGRTNPSLGSLLNNNCDILQLDVVSLYDKLDENSICSFKKEVENYILPL